VDGYAFLPIDIIPVTPDYYIGEAYFSVLRYSAISKSVHFTSGTRVMTEGRFAISDFECNISEELAALNGLSIGSAIEMINRDKNEMHPYTVVGIYADNNHDSTKELELVPDIIREDSVLFATTGFQNISANFVLLPADTDSFYFTHEWGRHEYGYDAAVYRLRNEKDIDSFRESISPILPEQFVILDSSDVAIYIRHVLDRTISGFTWILIIIGIVSILLCTLLFFHVLKNRMYDIGVLRAKGMTRVKTAFSLTYEIIVVFLLSYIAAVILYIASFIPVSSFMYNESKAFVSRDSSFWSDFDSSVMNAAHDYEFSASVHPVTLVYGFIAVVFFTLATGFFTTLFISRHEPIKTMTRY
jgi:putative ABC transport system permease protein